MNVARHSDSTVRLGPRTDHHKIRIMHYPVSYIIKLPAELTY